MFLAHATIMCDANDGFGNGRADIDNFADHMNKFVKSSRSKVHVHNGSTESDESSDAELLVAGWSWRSLSFHVWHISRDSNGDYQKHAPFSKGALNVHTDNEVAFAGNGAPEAWERLTELCESRASTSELLQWEPLEVLMDMCQDQEVRHVGGVPQVVVVNQYGLTEMFLAWGPDFGSDEQDFFLGGRPLGDTFRSDLRALVVTRPEADRIEFEFDWPVDLSIVSSSTVRALLPDESSLRGEFRPGAMD